MVDLEAIFARRSIRKYTSDSVKDEDITKLLQAAMATCNNFVTSSSLIESEVYFLMLLLANIASKPTISRIFEER